VNKANDLLRILSIVPYKVFPAVMGGQKGIALFYKYFSKEVSLTCLTVKKNEANESYPVLNQLSDSKLRYINPFLFFKIKNIATDNACTHLLFEHPYYAWLICLFKLFSSYKIIVHSHNIESERFKSIGKWWWKILWYYERMAYRLATNVWFKTDEDKEYAQLYFKLDEKKCMTIPYGIEATKLPGVEELRESKKQVQQLYSISENDLIILFNGTLNYKPNLDALRSILDNINPLLLKTSLQYKFIICGKGLPAEMEGLNAYRNSNIIYAGFVDDIDLYFKACDMFLNPLQDGGGIKTKLVEALGFGKKCVSSNNGAIGVPETCTGGRLMIVSDKDWNAYANAILEKSEQQIVNDNQNFYTLFSWKNIARKAAGSLHDNFS